MAVRAISKRVVDSIRPDATRDTFVWDRETKGFGVKVTPSGRRVYVLQYRERGMGRRGTVKRFTIGEHGQITADQARARAEELRATVTLGADPAKQRRKRREAATMTELGTEFLADVDAHRKPATAREYRRLWEKHVAPALASYKVEGVDVTDVRRLHRSLRETSYIANRVLALLGSAFSFAEAEGLRARHTNPAHDVTPFPEHARETYLTPEELGRLGEVLREAETKGLAPAPKRRRTRVTAATLKHFTPHILTPANPYLVAAVRLLVLTGCREKEILHLRWDQVDVVRGFLRLSDTKTGKSERPLPAAALELLTALPREEGSPWVLPGRVTGEPLQDVSRFWDAVRHALGMPELRLHDLRHTFASVSALGGKSLLIIGKLLGHRNARTTARYAHLGDDPVKVAADQAGADIAGWLRQRVNHLAGA